MPQKSAVIFYKQQSSKVNHHFTQHISSYDKSRLRNANHFSWIREERRHYFLFSKMTKLWIKCLPKMKRSWKRQSTSKSIQTRYNTLQTRYFSWMWSLYLFVCTLIKGYKTHFFFLTIHIPNYWFNVLYVLTKTQQQTTLFLVKCILLKCLIEFKL